MLLMYHMGPTQSCILTIRTVYLLGIPLMSYVDQHTLVSRKKMKFHIKTNWLMTIETVIQFFTCTNKCLIFQCETTLYPWHHFLTQLWTQVFVGPTQSCISTIWTVYLLGIPSMIMSTQNQPNLKLYDRWIKSLELLFFLITVFVYFLP